MSQRILGLCAICDLRTGGEDGWVCEAYPDEIPREILLGQADHRRPLPGDRGITFVQDPSAHPQLVERILGLLDSAEPVPEE